MDRTFITIFTDGSCTTKNDKKGGFGVYLQCEGFECTLRKGYWNTTISRMEMRALLAGLKMVNINTPTKVVVYSDSKFVVEAIRSGSLMQWRTEGWIGVANDDIWKEIVIELEKHRQMQFLICHTQGHLKNLDDPIIFGNNVADLLADYKTQESYLQDKDLENKIWVLHESSDCICIISKDEFEELNKMGDIYVIGDCYRANEEELLNRLNGTWLFEPYYNSKFDVNFTI